MKTAIYVSLAVMLVALTAIALTGCPLDPAKAPPCSDTARWPDPCAAAPRDAGIDG